MNGSCLQVSLQNIKQRRVSNYLINKHKLATLLLRVKATIMRAILKMQKIYPITGVS